jgi:orotate phosphoribosyltransferase-like protein
VLLDKDAKNCDGEAYLVKKLEELKNNEFNKHAISDEMLVSQSSYSPAKD